MLILQSYIVRNFFCISSVIWLVQLWVVETSDIEEKNELNKEDLVDTVCRQLGTGEHCYFLERSTFQDNWNIQDLVSICKERVLKMTSKDGCIQITSVGGLAIETIDELLFVEDYITSFYEPQLEALTSGCWSCKLSMENPNIKDFCGIWQGWNSSIDSFILQYQSCGFYELYNCPLNNKLQHFILQKTSGEIYWKLATNEVYSPIYVACEYIVEKAGNYSIEIPRSITSTDVGSVGTPEVGEISVETGNHGKVRDSENNVKFDLRILGGIYPSEKDCVLCQKIDDYGSKWTACSGEVSNQSCPDNAVGYATWRCGKDGNFVNDEPDYINCRNKWIADLEFMVEQKNASDEITECFLSYSVENNFFGHEIAELADLLYNVSKLIQEQAAKDNPTHKAEVYESLLPKLANITNNVIRREQPWKQINMVLRAFSGSKLQEFLYNIGFTLIKAIFEGNNKDQIYLDYSFSNLRIGMQLTSPNQSNNQIVINYPKNFTDNAGSIAVYGVIKTKKGKFPTLVTSVATIMDNKTGNRLYPEEMRGWRVPSNMVLNSAVISFDFKGLSRNKLNKHNRETKNVPLRIGSVIIQLFHSIPARGPSEQLIRRDLFAGETPTAVISHAHCVFWNDSFQVRKWDESGCRMTFTNETMTKCNCSHLSSFGVFMSIHKYENKGLAMELLSGICSVLSVICLILTLIVFQLFGAYLQGERETICRNVCSCLLATHILSLAVLDKTYFNLSDTTCSCFGAILHYLLSASFLWMAAEGHHLYKLILRVMDGTGKDLRMIYYIVSYGTSLLLVGLTALIGILQGKKAYGNPELCWLSLSNYQWSFISEAILISLVNSVILSLSLKAAVAAGGKSAIQKLRIWLHGWFTLSSLLGITWFIGIATFNLNVYFEYVFVALNGLQGVWIFLNRVIRNEQLKNILVKRWRKWKLLRRFYNNSVSGHSLSNHMGTSDKLKNKDPGKNRLWNVEEVSNTSSLQGNQALGDNLALRVLQDSKLITNPEFHSSQSGGSVRGRFISY